MKFSKYTAVYALTLLISAALLFSVQPMFSKMILPLLGGTPHVWNTAMVFFQLTLLAGYAYAHGTTRILSVRVQALVHLALLGVFATALPFLIPAGEIPPAGEDPTFWQLTIMATVIGGPFFILSGSAPMFQRWFAQTDHPDSDNPYFLYGASNLGSMSSLLAYPVLIEPYLTLDMQSEYWMYGYYLLIAMTVISTALVWTHAQKKDEEPSTMDEEKITWKRRGYWLLMAFLPSSLMLGVTTFITTDIASAPLLWILPLALYVGTFILVFARKPLLSMEQITIGFGASLAIMFTCSIAWNDIHPAVFVGMHLLVFFFAAMLCHGKLAEARPQHSHLTEFYLLMSVGGALGGIFNALIAPQLLIIPVEYALVLAAILFVRYAAIEGQDWKTRYTEFRHSMKERGSDAFFEIPILALCILVVTIVFMSFLPGRATTGFGAAILIFGFMFLLKTRWCFAYASLAALLIFPPGYYWHTGLQQKIIHYDRNFFGVMRIADVETGERAFFHGTTNHGTQPLDEEYRLTPLSYYSKYSPINDVYNYLAQKPGAQRIGVIGLGVGVTSCFTKEGRSYDFYEIDADVAAIAENTDFYTYLSDCGSPYKIILGDGRLTMANAEKGIYDMIFIDAYSSDNIPIHIITVEALEMYEEKLTDDGIIIVNISNNFLDLEPVFHENAKLTGMTSLGHLTEGGEIEGTELFGYPAQYVVHTRNESAIAFLRESGWTDTMPRSGVRAWKDQYSNIVSVLDNVTGQNRFNTLMEAKKKEEEAKETENSEKEKEKEKEE